MNWVRVELGKWPQNISRLYAKCTIKVNYHNKFIQPQIHAYNTDFLLGAIYHFLEIPYDLKTGYPSSIIVDITVSEVWIKDKDDVEVAIDESKWNEYDIIN